MNDARKEELERYLDGELPPEQQARVTQELTSDAAAAQYLTRIRRLRSLAQRHDPGLAHPIVAWPLVLVPTPSRLWQRSVLALAAACILGLGIWGLFRGLGIWNVPPKEGEQPLLASRGMGRSMPVASTMFSGGMGRQRRLPASAEILALELVNAAAPADASLRREMAQVLTQSRHGHVGASAEARDPPMGPLSAAKAMLAKEDWTAAAAAFGKLLREQPAASFATEARLWHGYALVKQDEFEQAILALQPFETNLADDRWADDALAQLGYAYQGADRLPEAIATWKRLLDKHEDSLWRQEALLNILDIHFYEQEDFAACLPYCEWILKEDPEPGAAWEARHVGAYCLNALQRFDDANRWIEQWFGTEDAGEEAWRILLAAQQNLIRGQTESALKALASIDDDFPDLDVSDQLDIWLATAAMLRQNGHTDRARGIVRETLPRLAGYSAEEIGWVLDELNHIEDKPEALLAELRRLGKDGGIPERVRVVIWRRYAAESTDEEAAKAADFLRDILAEQKQEYPRAQAALLLAELLHDELEEPHKAVKVLEELLPALKRRDLVQQVRHKLEEYRGSQ